jgi:plasmid stability protein
MPNISVKDVPEAWAEALRQRAARNHRSLQGELMAIIEGAIQEYSPMADANPSQKLDTLPSNSRMKGSIVGFDRFGHPITQQGWKTVEQVSAEMRVKYPEPVTDLPLGVDIIRAERDAR